MSAELFTAVAEMRRLVVESQSRVVDLAERLGLEDLVTLRNCLSRRGRAAMDDLGVIGEMSGVAVHLVWRP